MAVTNGYCTEAEVRDQLADAGSRLDADLIERAINAASRAIDQFCGRRFWKDASATTRLYRPRDPLTVMVDDIATTAGLVIRTDTTGDGSWATTWASSDYQLEPLNSDVVAGGDTVTPYAWWRIVAIGAKTFPVHELRTTLQVTARGGWSAVPDDVRLAAIIKSVGLFKRKDTPLGIGSFGEFAMRISRQDSDVAALLAPYVRISRPDL